MRLVFVSNYINHHQMPVSRELNRLCREQGGSYVFVQTEPMEQERVDMGWGEENLKEGDFVRSYWEDENGCQRMIEEADAVIFGGCEDERYIEARLEAGKPVWRYSEPLYKTGRYKFVSPRGLRKKYHDHTRYRKKRVYLLCAGAYVAGDFRLVGAYGGKRFRYGYFPAFRQQDPKKLMAGKDQASQGQLRLLWAARMIDWKHPETALQVAAGLREQGIDFRLDMIGGGALAPEMQERARALGLEGQVAFLGYRSPEETRDYMEKAHIFLATSDRQEGWGAVVNEAMNSGCALIAGKGMGAAPYLVRHGENGYLYDHKNPRQAVELAGKLAKDAAQRRRLGSAAYETVRTLWNSQVAAQRLYACIAAEIAGQELPEYEEGPLSRDLICL
jgi:glycosyltransferase involved in cell wall biosynthesis